MATAALRGDHDGSGGADTTTTAAAEATATAGMAFGRRTRVVCHGVRFPCRRRRRSAPTRTHRRSGRAAARLGPRRPRAKSGHTFVPQLSRAHRAATV